MMENFRIEKYEDSINKDNGTVNYSYKIYHKNYFTMIPLVVIGLVILVLSSSLALTYTNDLVLLIISLSGLTIGMTLVTISLFYFKHIHKYESGFKNRAAAKKYHEISLKNNTW